MEPINCKTSNGANPAHILSVIHIEMILITQSFKKDRQSTMIAKFTHSLTQNPVNSLADAADCHKTTQNLHQSI